MKFQKDKLELLKSLRDLVLEDLRNSTVNVDLEYDTSEVLMEITDRKRSRRLKLIKRELDSWIDETKTLRKESKYATPVVDS